MIVLIKLILAHFIGDFLLQPKSWVDEKEIHKAKSLKLYIHILIHGLLVLLVLWDFNHWLLALLIMAAHGIIDTIKLYVQKERNKSYWFIIDQALHITSILVMWFLIFIGKGSIRVFQLEYRLPLALFHTRSYSS